MRTIAKRRKIHTNTVVPPKPNGITEEEDENDNIQLTSEARMGEDSRDREESSEEGNEDAHNGIDPNKIVPLTSADIKAKAEALRDRLKLPPVPGKSVGFEEMQEWLGLLTPAMWDKVMVYCYRTFPQIINQLVDPNAKDYIDVYKEPFTKEEFVNKHGGGDYKFNVTGPSRVVKEAAFEARLSVNWQRIAPKLNYKTLDMTQPRNSGYIQSLRLAGELSPEKEQNMEKERLSQEQIGLMREMMTHFRTMSKDQIEDLKEQIKTKSGDSGGMLKMIEMIVSMNRDQYTMLMNQINNSNSKRNEDNSPSNTVAMLTAMTSMLDKFVAVKQDQSKSSAEAESPLMKMLIEQNRSLMTLILEQKSSKSRRSDDDDDDRDSGDIGSHSFISKMKDFLEAANMVKGRAPERSTMDTIMERAPEILNPIAQVISSSMLAFAAKRGAIIPPEMLAVQKQGLSSSPLGHNTASSPSSGGSTPAYGPRIAPDPLRSPTMGIVAGDQIPQNTPQGGMLNGVDTQTEETIYSEQAKKVIQQNAAIILNAMNNDSTGFEFAENIEGLLGKAAIGSVVMLGEDRLLAAAKAVPEFYTAAVATLGGEAGVHKWIHELVNYRQIIERLDMDPEAYSGGDDTAGTLTSEEFTEETITAEADDNNKTNTNRTSHKTSNKTVKKGVQ